MLGNEVVITGKRAFARSFAKINLTLDVTGKREDGYHNVEMVMQSVSLFDFIIAEKREDGIELSTNLKYLPVNEKNIAYKAAMMFFEYTGIKGGIKLTVRKNIPVAAGLAGGSGNCAAVLCLMNKLYNAGLSTEELCALGAKCGADVPYCIFAETMLASGIGDILSPLPRMPQCTVLLVKPNINVSTAAVYESIDAAPHTKRPDTRAMISALEDGNLHGIAKNLCNVMESVTENMYPVIHGIKEKMIKNGALGAVMSGSGPTVFGIFDDYQKAKLSHDSFALQFKDTFLVNTI